MQNGPLPRPAGIPKFPDRPVPRRKGPFRFRRQNTSLLSFPFSCAEAAGVWAAHRKKRQYAAQAGRRALKRAKCPFSIQKNPEQRLRRPAKGILRLFGHRLCSKACVPMPEIRVCPDDQALLLKLRPFARHTRPAASGAAAGRILRSFSRACLPCSTMPEHKKTPDQDTLPWSGAEKADGYAQCFAGRG